MNRTKQYHDLLLTMKLMGDLNTVDTKKFVRLYNHKMHLQEVAHNRVCTETVILRQWKKENAKAALLPPKE
jgi:hypothetical protein